MSEIRVENIIGETGVDAVNFTKGVNVTGIVTTTAGVSIPASTTSGLDFGTGTNKAQLAMQSGVSNRIALRTTHSTLGDNNPLVINQPSGAAAQNDALVISTGGIVTKAKQPGFTATTNAEYNISTNVTLTYNNVQTNNGNCYDGSTSTFTAPVSGLYYFSFDYYAQTNNVARAVMKKSTDGGSSYSIFRYGCRVNSPNNYVSATTSGLIALNANDRVLLEREDGIVHINNPFNFFSMFLIG
jgi:hypothetical protein